jgi:transposase-like protein
MDVPLSEEERSAGNRRNALMSKHFQAQLGEVTVHTPRDPHSSFELEFVKKRETLLAEGVSERIIGLYALGTLGLSFLRVL